MKRIENTFGQPLPEVEYTRRKGSYAIIFNDNREVAIMKTDGGYFLPGGGIEEGENEVDALHREILEETGYVLKSYDYFTTMDQYLFGKTQRIHYHVVGAIYICKLNQKHTEPIEKDHELKWIKPHEAKRLMRLEYQGHAIEMASSFTSEAHRPQV